MKPKTSPLLIHLSLSADGSSLRTSTLNGTSYLIAPVTSKVGDRVEWPANAPTPELIPADVLTFATESRNNRPVVMGHPMRNGEYVSANKYPEILERYCFGHVFNAEYSEDDKTVTCEIWLDADRAIIVDSHLGGNHAQRVVERLKNGETVEVSEGNFVVAEKTSGVYDGKEYGAIWRLCIGDHLAVLNENQKGACSVEDGCGALRAASEMMTSPWSYPSSLSVSILSQARRPTFSGTETSSWSSPSFSEYIKYLHEGKEGTGPTSVSQCSSELKRLISSHSLLGDPEGNNLSDLTFFPCVNPSNGKLNEKALRAIVGSRGSQADIDEKAKVSAQDMARRLLNSEFGVELEVSSDYNKEEGDDPMNNNDKAGRGLFSRALKSIQSLPGLLKSSISNNLLRNKLEDAIRGMEPGFYWLEDWDQDAGTVQYTTRIVYGFEYDSKVEMHCYQRSFTLDGDGIVTVNDDRVEVEYIGTYQPIKDDNGEDTGDISVSVSSSCQCQHNDKGDHDMDRKAAITRICSISPVWEKNRKVLEGLDDDGLMKLSEEVDSKEEKVEGKENVTATTTPPVTPPVTTPDPPPTSNLESISASELATLKVQAAKFQAAENAHRITLIGKLKSSSAFTEDRLSTMSTDDLETLAKSLKLEDSSTPPQYDFSGRGVSFIPTETKSHKAPDTWAISAAEHAAKEKAKAN